MAKLYDVIMQVVEKPELYLGKRSVQRLYTYIGGFLHDNDSGNDGCLDGFNEYIAARYRINSDHNWASIIEFFSTNEQQEIQQFKAYFEEFTKLKNAGKNFKDTFWYQIQNITSLEDER